jgi:geranylgeranyl reductase family protein
VAKILKMEQFDAIVVGAGPAGSTMAYRLAREGAKALLVDKARFPRDKPCGGGISVRARRELPIDPEPVVERVIDRLELSFRGRRGFVRGGSKPLASLTQRRRLDHFLIEKAVEAGVDFRDGVVVSEAAERGVRIDGTWIDSELLIGSDGANGSTSKSLGLAHKPIYGVAFEGNVAASRSDLERWRSTVVIELGTVPGGYCWIFPKGDHVNVGVGGWESAGPTLRNYLKNFCEQRGFEILKAPEPEGLSAARASAGAALARGRAALIGDAAGLVDPLAGDGMYAAFLSSRLATDAAMDLLAGRITDLTPYARALVSEFGRMFGFAWNAKIAFDRFPRLSLGAVLSPPGWRTLEDMLCGEIREPERARGAPGIAVRGFELAVQRLGWLGAEYRIEAGTAASFGLGEAQDSRK